MVSENEHNVTRPNNALFNRKSLKSEKTNRKMSETPTRGAQESVRSAQETARTPQESARGGYNYQDSARVQRSGSRATLQPSVHDFNGNIINRAIDEEQVVWMVGKNHAKILPAATEYAYPVPATFRGSGAYGPLQWESARLPLTNRAVRAPAHRTDRTAAWAEEVHRRHVARTARARARVSPKQRTERVVATNGGVNGGPVYVNNHQHHYQQQHQQHDSSFSLSLPANEADNMDDVRLTSLSRLSRTDGCPTARSRPATTGRYFDTSNGLRNLRSNGPAILRSRPTTASQFSGPGLNVRKSTLFQKELVT